MHDLQTTIAGFLEDLGVADAGLASAWASLSEPRSVPRGGLLLQAGDRPQHFWLIASGACRYYYSTHDGRERNKAFFAERGLIGSLSAIFSEGPAPFSIEMLEATELVQTPIARFLALAARMPAVDAMLQRYTRRLFIRNERREAVLLTQDMEGRLRWVREHEPWIVERVPQYHVASYLGMDPVSLSRLKSRDRAKKPARPRA